MRCDKHRKDQIGGCMWCGKRLCDFCIAKRERTKLYCDKCCSTLRRTRRQRLPSTPVMPVIGRRFVFKEGFLYQEGR